MKVRHKDKHYIVGEVFQESPSHYLVYLPNTESDSPLYAYPKTTFEPVPTDRWQDVTGECEVVEGVSGQQYVNHGDHHFGVVNYTPYYRLRKVQMWEELQRSTEEWAFRVERKVSD